jgi:plasmid replication initiation protein
MESTKSYQENFAQLRKWVIEPAVKELRVVSDLEITWSPHKTGRKVSKLLFLFKPTEQMSLPLSPPDAQ